MRAVSETFAPLIIHPAKCASIAGKKYQQESSGVRLQHKKLVTSKSVRSRSLHAHIQIKMLE